MIIDLHGVKHRAVTESAVIFANGCIRKNWYTQVGLIIFTSYWLKPSNGYRKTEKFHLGFRMKTHSILAAV